MLQTHGHPFGFIVIFTLASELIVLWHGGTAVGSWSPATGPGSATTWPGSWRAGVPARLRGQPARSAGQPGHDHPPERKSQPRSARPSASAFSPMSDQGQACGSWRQQNGLPNDALIFGRAAGEESNYVVSCQPGVRFATHIESALECAEEVAGD